MKLPYGITDFYLLRTESYLYVDKTGYIQTLEKLNSRYLFYIRPRRFGKSLFLSMLEHYYGIEHKSQFERLFGDLQIGQHPTDQRNRYLVLRLNFSGLNTSGPEPLHQAFTERVKNTVIGACYTYRHLLTELDLLQQQVRGSHDASAVMDLWIGAAKKTGRRVYLIIDEYDHFANDIIAMGDAEFYRQIVRSAGFVRDFYETVKIGTESVIDRIFITGITPIMLDDLTSGFNISANITMNPLLNEMLGFTESEVQAIMDNPDFTPGSQQWMNELRLNYNGYLFNEGAKQRVYNPDMILYFFDQWQMTGNFPENLVDDNIRTDYGRLNRLAANERNRKVLEDIIANEQITATIVSRFSFDRMYDDQYFVSLLFYMGMLTIDRQDRMRLLLKIPNYVIKTMYWEYIEQNLRRRCEIIPDHEPLRHAVEAMAYEGTIRPYMNFIGEHVIRPLSNRDLREFNEKYIKVLLFAYMVESKAYRPYSERETEHGYLDIYLEKDPRFPDISYEWLIELKYLRKSDAHEFETVKQEGLDQLNRYAASRDFVDRPGLRKALVVFIGKDRVEVVE